MTRPVGWPADWAEAESRRLLDFARAARRPEGGFGWLDAAGRLEPDRAPALWIECRMTYVFTLAHLRGEPDAASYADHGLAALDGATTDAAYEHAFVLLATAAATAAGRPGATALLERAIEVLDERFWDEASGTVVDVDADGYRGANANMHAVEAFLAVGDTTGDPRWAERAARVAERFVAASIAREGRMPEHFDADWVPLLDFNRDRPADPFRPYGATVGHGFEWSRLLTQLHGGPTDEARLLFDAAARDGWAVDGEPGFVYTVDWDGTPVVRERMHWVAAEAVLAAHALGVDAGPWWEFVRAHHVDPVGGSWWHELDERNRPAGTVWPGKPDVYHAYQACVLPSLPLRPTAAVALAGG